jgi:hypothetical protein
MAWTISSQRLCARLLFTPTLPLSMLVGRAVGRIATKLSILDEGMATVYGGGIPNSYHTRANHSRQEIVIIS